MGFKYKCPVCKRTVESYARRYLAPEYIPEDWQTPQAFVYALDCRAMRTCEDFYVAKYCQDDDAKKPIRRLLDGISLWNQAQANKPNKQKYGTTYCKWSIDVKQDTGVVYDRVMRRERLFGQIYPTGMWAKVAEANKKRPGARAHAIALLFGR